MDTQIPKTQKLVARSKAIKPSQQEIDSNPRSRSSVLRIAERVQI